MRTASHPSIDTVVRERANHFNAMAGDKTALQGIERGNLQAAGGSSWWNGVLASREMACQSLMSTGKRCRAEGYSDQASAAADPAPGELLTYGALGASSPRCRTISTRLLRFRRHLNLNLPADQIVSSSDQSPPARILVGFSPSPSAGLVDDIDEEILQNRFLQRPKFRARLLLKAFKSPNRLRIGPASRGERPYTCTLALVDNTDESILQSSGKGLAPPLAFAQPSTHQLWLTTWTNLLAIPQKTKVIGQGSPSASRSG
ncbi:hypothetical protein IWZ03DRAFT_439614 [Phyllosticta citriasiana]|uniref:Uncharacterized protein n=1 Tax=Phyllosticta citriasiana TaxID=595635 RepID=A0ABR1KLY0_9PEZI